MQSDDDGNKNLRHIFTWAYVRI